MAVSIRTVVNHIPKAVLKKYCDFHQVPFATPIDWTQDDKAVASALEEAINALPKSDYDPLHSHLERINVVASDRGIRALINASDKPAEMEKRLKAMENSHHRAMAVFLEDNDLFKIAEELLFVDFRAEGRSWQHCAIKMDGALDDITEDDANEFAFEVAKIIHHNFNDRRECCGEVYKRYSDGTRQISVYVNDFPNSDIQVKDKQLHRVNTKKAIVAAVVYDPQTKQLCTVVGGGKDNHERVRQAFAKAILKRDAAEFTPTEPVCFAIDKFKSRPIAPMLRTKPEDNIDVVRVRKLDLSCGAPCKHIVTVDTMPQGKGSDMYAIRTYFDEDGKLRAKYTLLHVVLSFHFRPKKEGGYGRVIHISLKKDGSDLKSLKEDDRQMIEGYLKQWGILEDIAPEQTLELDPEFEEEELKKYA
ncbi:MAG: hypothetical protein IPI58_06050 [Alphaproteobacteria bacterium]|nr:MAG: hypothetical protein IPI58_06050 [Alphaproteobacteria bacterium]